MRHVCPECGETASAPGACPRDGARLAPADDPLLGETIGSYRVAARIGQGGMGRVYRAVHPRIGARVAIKVLAAERAHDLVEIERFFAEARVVNLIQSETIVNVLDMLVLPDGSPCIVMEHLDGAPLSSHIARGPMSPRDAGGLALQILAALEAAHAKGVVHRDLKPDNVFVTPGGRVKVLDFGIAKSLHAAAGTGPTRAGAVLGTPAYVAPEQVREAREIDGRADVYSLGVVLFEALTARLPFAGDSAFDLLRAHVETPPPALRTFAPGVPAAVERVVLCAMSKDPADRYPTARAMADDLRAALEAEGDEPVPSTTPMPRPPETPAPAPSPRTSPLVALAVALIVVVAIVGAGGVGLQSRVAVRGPFFADDPVEGGGAFDVSAYLPKAEARARQAAPDAELVMLSSTPMNRSGLLDVGKENNGAEARYRFVGTRNGAVVNVFVMVTSKRVRTLVGDVTDEPTRTGPPRCTAREVLAKTTLAADAFDIQYLRMPRENAALWSVTGVRAGGRETFPDTCAR